LEEVVQSLKEGMKGWDDLRQKVTNHGRGHKLAGGGGDSDGLGEKAAETHVVGACGWEIDSGIVFQTIIYHVVECRKDGVAVGVRPDGRGGDDITREGLRTAGWTVGDPGVSRSDGKESSLRSL
jgi:hypothetical protein